MKTSWVAGVDEVGRGPLAGPVTVGVVLMRRADARNLPPLHDSKKLTKNGRKRAVREYIRGGVRFSVASVSAKIVDEKGISVALRRAVAVALRRVGADPKTTEILLDGSLSAPQKYSQRTIVHGDESVPLIALASSVAKLHRDALMERYARVYSGYGFERHAGYGTRAHYLALRKLGPSPIHRKTFIH